LNVCEDREMLRGVKSKKPGGIAAYLYSCNATEEDYRNLHSPELQFPTDIKKLRKEK
jgi:hypothetical protein